MAHGFKVVPLSADDEVRMVVGVVMRAQALRTVVCAACRRRGAVKGTHLLARVGHEVDVQRRWVSCGLEEAQGHI